MRVRLGLSAALLCLAAVTAGADWQQGMEAYHRADFSGAEGHFSQLIAANPCYAGAHYMLGLAQLGMELPQQALASLRRATVLDGVNPLYRLALGQACVEAGRPGDGYAVLAVLDGEGLAPAERSTLTLLVARAAMDLGSPAEAARVLSAGVDSDPDNPRLHQALGVAHSALGNGAEALLAFRQAFGLQRDDPASARSAVHAALSVARESEDESARRRAWAEAAELAEALAGLAPSFEHELLAGEAWLEAGRYRRALQWCDRVQARRARNALVNLYRGRCHLGLGELDQALAALQQALIVGARGKLRAEIYAQLCEVYNRLGDEDRAISACREAGQEERARTLEESAAGPPATGIAP